MCRRAEVWKWWAHSYNQLPKQGGRFLAWGGVFLCCGFKGPLRKTHTPTAEAGQHVEKELHRFILLLSCSRRIDLYVRSVCEKRAKNGWNQVPGLLTHHLSCSKRIDLLVFLFWQEQCPFRFPKEARKEWVTLFHLPLNSWFGLYAARLTQLASKGDEVQIPKPPIQTTK